MTVKAYLNCHLPFFDRPAKSRQSSREKVRLGSNCLEQGFTLIELLVVMGIVAALAGIAVVNLIQPQTSASIVGTVDTLVSELKSQQIKAMSGDSISGAAAQAHGVYVMSDRYVLFKGATYSAVDPDNQVIQFDPQLNLSFSSAPSNQVVFQKGSGEPSGFTSLTISNASESRVINLNRFGAITVN